MEIESLDDALNQLLDNGGCCTDKQTMTMLKELAKERIKQLILAKKKWEFLDCLVKRLYLNGVEIIAYSQNREYWSVYGVYEEEYILKTEQEARAFCEAELEKYVEGLIA